MKTSKRLLSFFLAVVMVITTCSVGFAAFAAEPEDEVFTYVDDEGKAVTLTYDGLNKLVDTYAPVLIEALRSTLEGAGVNVDAVLASENPIGELLAQLSPMLMGLLGTSSDMQTILGSDYNAFSEEKYSYLDDPDATIDFGIFILSAKIIKMPAERLANSAAALLKNLKFCSMLTTALMNP